MIGGLVEHDGHRALAIHLANSDDNESVRIRTHGLSAQTIAGAIAEMQMMALGSRTAKPLIHSWASPGKTYCNADWEHHRTAFEKEFGLEGFPCLEVFQLKLSTGGRMAGHVHRVYLRIGIDGKAVRTSHSAIRQEKVSRIAEVAAGERLTSGCFNCAIIAQLRLEGRHDIADAMVRAGLGDKQATAAPTSAERARSERLNDLAADEVWRRVHDAWRRADTGAAFQAALADGGLRLAMGEKCPVVVTPAGAVHPLLRAINKGGERARGTAVRKAELDHRLGGVDFPIASTLKAIPGFDAGVFAITGLVRQPLVASQPVAPVDPERHLSQGQRAALSELSDAFHHGAAERARTTRAQIEAEVHQTIGEAKSRRLRERLAAEKAAWDLPTIHVPGWRDIYRAELAGLPAKYGAHLRWVDKLDAERRRVVLRSGVTITLAPAMARADSATADTIAIMIAHAQQQGWSSVTINGGTRKWRVGMAAAAIRASISVTDTNLHEAADARTIRMEQERLLVAWWQARQHLAALPEHQRREHRHVVLNALARVAGSPRIIELTADAAQRRALLADLAAYERYQDHMYERPSVAPPPRPR